MTTIKRKTSLNDEPSGLIVASVKTFILHYNEAAWSIFFNFSHINSPCVLNVCVFQYLSGFGNEFSSEDPRCPGSLPEGQVPHTQLNAQQSGMGPWL